MRHIEAHEQVVDGLRINYYAAGMGEPLVLLHGIGDSACDWLPVMESLAATRRVIAPDLPGAGDSDKPAIDYSTRAQVPYLVGLLDQLGIERADLAGHSRGGIIALHTALAHPWRISRLMLVDSGALGKAISPTLVASTTPALAELAIYFDRTPVGALMRARLRSFLLFSRPWRTPDSWLDDQVRLTFMPGFLEATLAALRAQTDGLAQREVLLDRLPELTMPVQVIWGADDRVVPLEQAHNAVTWLPNGRLDIIADSGHIPHVEQPAVFSAQLQAFLHSTGATETTAEPVGSYQAGDGTPPPDQSFAPASEPYQ